MQFVKSRSALPVKKGSQQPRFPDSAEWYSAFYTDALRTLNYL